MKTVLSLFAAALAAVCGYAEAALACHITPIELLQRGMQMWPMRVRTNSGNAKQWAGYTDLASGTASVTISTQMVNSDSIINLTAAINTTATSGMVGNFTLSNRLCKCGIHVPPECVVSRTRKKRNALLKLKTDEDHSFAHLLLRPVQFSAMLSLRR